MRVVTDVVLLALLGGLAVLAYTTREKASAGNPGTAPAAAVPKLPARPVPPSSSRAVNRGGVVARRGPSTRATTRAAPATRVAPAPLTSKDALYCVQELALNFPNPQIREAAYRDHDRDWSFDLEAHTFTLAMRTNPPSVVSGKFAANEAGWWVAHLDAERALTRGWIPPQDERPSAEEARGALVAMCVAMKDDWNIQRFGEVLKTASLVVDVPTKTLTARNEATGLDRISWTIDLEKREFSVKEGFVDVVHDYQGKFGWNKKRQWVAWAVHGGILFTAGGIRYESFLVTCATPVSIE